MDYVFDSCTAQPGSTTTLIVTTTVVTTFSLLALLRHTLYPKKRSIIPNPLKTAIPRLSQSEIEKLEYAPDYFPGARDVQTPYGSIRVYEFGPEDGRKVLMIHGISTSCQTLTHIAHGLVAKGCRVMLFDLWGRGFSDGVGDLPHDARLYVSQALLVLASSPLAWTGAGGFHLLGYSLGGGIAVHLATAFPDMVASLVLLAPAGLIRAANFGRLSRFVFKTGVVPERVLAALTRRRLQRPIASSTKRRKPGSAGNSGASTPVGAKSASSVKPHSPTTPVEEFVDIAVEEAADPVGDEVPSELQRRVWRYVRWMVQYHDGFIPSFMSTVRYAPMMDQEAAWARLADRKAGTTCFIFGKSDEVVHPDDYEQDALPLVGGREHVSWNLIRGGHDFPMSHPDETLSLVYEFWGWQ